MAGVSVCGCRERGLDGYEGIVLGVYIAGCTLCIGDSCDLVVVMSSDCIVREGVERVYVHDGWARGFKGFHIVYGVRVDSVSDIPRRFYEITGFRRGFAINTVIGSGGYANVCIDGGRIADLYTSDKCLWKGLFVGVVTCLLSKGVGLDKMFSYIVDYVVSAVEHNDPLYSYRSRASVLDSIEDHLKYISRIVKLKRLWSITDSLAIYTKPTYSDRIVFTEVTYNPISPIVNGPLIIHMSRDKFAEYVSVHGGSILCIDSVPESLREKLVDKGIKIDLVGGRNVLWSNSLKNIVLVLEKMLGS